MSRTFGLPLTVFVSVLLAANAIAAEPDRARAPRSIWGTVTKATAESITIAPEIAARRKPKAADEPAEKPAEQTFALAKDQTEFMFAEVGMARPMNDGTMVRTLMNPERAAATDLKEGQLVQVTLEDGAGDGGAGGGNARSAKRVVIVWSVSGTIVKVDGDSITFRPTAAADADDANAATADQTLKISKTATRVRIATTTD